MVWWESQGLKTTAITGGKNSLVASTGTSVCSVQSTQYIASIITFITLSQSIITYIKIYSERSLVERDIIVTS